MNVTAPPRPPRGSDPLERAELEALFEEARQRQRRRRRVLGILASLAAIGAVLVLAVSGRTGLGRSAALEFSDMAGASDEGKRAELIVHLFEMHNGYVLAYSDGRVIWQFDLGNQGESPMFERRLTPLGVDLIRSGAVRPSALLRETTPLGDVASVSSLPADAWAEPAIGKYVPSRYAVCPSLTDPVHVPGMTRNRLSDPMRIVDHIPAAARMLLRGKERIYDNVGLLFEAEPSPTACFEVSAPEARDLRNTFIAAGFAEASRDTGFGECRESGMRDDLGLWICPGVVSSGDLPGIFFVPVEGVGVPVEIVSIGVGPVFPHGEWVASGG